ncbi:ferric reductase like transmembrane component-domain-containing protein [Suillus americanus]|nr:ferric reductase like transmembrane component-domain-containing protein [Suillus americanus]
MEAATQSAASTSVTVNAFQLVFHIDVFLLALSAVFAVFALPRAVARFSRAAEWRHGHILRAIPLKRRAPKSPMRSVQSPPSGSAAADNLTSDESHTFHSEAHLIRHPAAKEEGWSLPPHVRAWSSRVPTFSNILRYRLDVSFSLGQGLILVIYSAALVYAGFLKSNPFVDPLRTGFVAVSQIPIVYLLATKNNILGIFLGLGYEKLNYIHRFAGTLLVIASNVHSLGYIYEWTINHTFSKNIRTPARIWALVALITVDLIYLFSIPFFRRRAYNLFYFSHVVFFILFLPAVHGHVPSVWPYVIATAGIISLDYLMRSMKTRVFNARIRPIPGLMLTRIEVPQLNAGWRAGQHVRLRVLSSAMGWIGWAESHPFTIATAAKSPEGMVLLCKKTGRWTSRLYDMATVAGYESDEGTYGRTVQVMIEGPYGGPGHCVFASYSAAIFIVGGSGISFALSAVQDILQRDSEGASRVKIIEVVWSVRDPASLTPLIPQLVALIQQSVYAPLKISVHYTRASDQLPGKDFLPPGLTLTAGRPKIAKVLDAVMSRAVSYGSNVKSSMAITGVVIGVCGPTGLGDDVAQVISQVDARRRWAVGGIEMHEETFGW